VQEVGEGFAARSLKGAAMSWAASAMPENSWRAAAAMSGPKRVAASLTYWKKCSMAGVARERPLVMPRVRNSRPGAMPW
jgi:hypothetical protein